MLFDSKGRGLNYGQTVKELTWDIFNDTALPSWLELVDGSISFADVASSRGIATLSTDATANATATLRLAFDVDTSQFTEVGFYVYSLQCDYAASQIIRIGFGDLSTTGAVMQNDSAGVHHAQVLPSGTDRTLDWAWGNLAVYAQRRKNIGMTLRPEKQQVYFTEGDHLDGDVPVWMSIGEWSDGILRPQLQIEALSANVRTLNFSKIKLRLCHF